MADIDNAHASNTDIKVGTVVVQGTKTNFNNNNFTGSTDDASDSEYISYTRGNTSHVYGMGNIDSKYDARFDDPGYYSA